MGEDLMEQRKTIDKYKVKLRSKVNVERQRVLKKLSEQSIPATSQLVFLVNEVVRAVYETERAKAERVQ